MSSIRGVYIYVALLVASMGVLADAQCTNGQMVPTGPAVVSNTNAVLVSLPGDQTAIKFTSSGTFTIAPGAGQTTTFLLVGGGGSGGTYGGGGGGGGQLLHVQNVLTPSGTYTVTVGAGGAKGNLDKHGSSGGSTNIKQGTTVIYTVSGGGAGGGFVNKNGDSACCAGGGGLNMGRGAGSGGGCSTDLYRWGYSGTNLEGGGGGGTGTGKVGASTGQYGLAFSYSGTSVYYGEGGAGCIISDTGPPVGGHGSGGYGGCVDTASYTSYCDTYRRDGLNETGSGGGGGDSNGAVYGGNGGSGIVFLVVSSALATPPSTCSCNAGYYLSGASTCTACATGTYSAGGTGTTCSACTGDYTYNIYTTFTGPGTTATDCPTSCVPRAYRSSGFCTPCNAGYYSAGGSTTSCLPCTNCTMTPAPPYTGAVRANAIGVTDDYLKWNSSGTLTLSTSLYTQVLVVGGGGKGGNGIEGVNGGGGGGGGGGGVTWTYITLPAGTCTITVGAGGGTSGNPTGNTGGTSRIQCGGTVMVDQPGGGAGGDAGQNGGNGASSGGGGGLATGGFAAGTSSTGGNRGCDAYLQWAGAGGGANRACDSTWRSDGGNGVPSNIMKPTYGPYPYGSGGGGGAVVVSYMLNNGYGGDPDFAYAGRGWWTDMAAAYRTQAPHDGTAETGGGGGGGCGPAGGPYRGGYGGSGIVVIRAPPARLDGTMIMTCNTGYYTDGMGGCSACTNGNAYSIYIGPGSTATGCPIYCVAGAYNSSGTCVPCAAGGYKSSVGSTVCTTCPAGSYCPAGATVATTCPAGSYCPTAGLSAATTCPAGTYCPTTGLSAYTTCPAGTYGSTVGATSYPCVQCPAGTYNSLTGRTDSLACVPCLPGWFGATPGSGVGPQQ